MALAWPFKDPDEVLDYIIDWTDRLDEGDLINSSAWEIAVGDAVLEIDSDTYTDNKTTVWLSAGTLGTVYQLTNRITTAGGRTEDQTVKLRIKAK